MEQMATSYDAIKRTFESSRDQAERNASAMFDLQRRLYEHLETNGDSACMEQLRNGLFNGKH